METKILFNELTIKHIMDMGMSMGIENIKSVHGDANLRRNKIFLIYKGYKP